MRVEFVKLQITRTRRGEKHELDQRDVELHCGTETEIKHVIAPNREDVKEKAEAGRISVIL